MDEAVYSLAVDGNGALYADGSFQWTANGPSFHSGCWGCDRQRIYLPAVLRNTLP